MLWLQMLQVLLAVVVVVVLMGSRAMRQQLVLQGLSRLSQW